tara:strand:- start:362 stop:517 length:156 start_codon:yes stop_codon:yes gene_type:complete
MQMPLLLSASFFWKVVVLQDGLLLLSLFTYQLIMRTNFRVCESGDAVGGVP